MVIVYTVKSYTFFKIEIYGSLQNFVLDISISVI